MAMVRNESVARIVMFMCFGTAILSLAVHWRLTKIHSPLEPAYGSIRNDRILGEFALGNKSTQQPVVENSRVTEISDTLSNTTQNNESFLKTPSVLPGESPNSQGLSTLKSSDIEVVVKLSDRRTYVYHTGEVIASYPIAIGKEGWETPTGSFRVRDMQKYPIWQHPITDKIFPSGPDSPLGDRWIGFWSDGRNEIGFHGTPDIHLLGLAISHGCLRMRNEDVRSLYNKLTVGTLVSVVP
jgi:lipoprotein-anchoring transpeptidase ErfK/SrfK